MYGLNVPGFHSNKHTQRVGEGQSRRRGGSESFKELSIPGVTGKKGRVHENAGKHTVPPKNPQKEKISEPVFMQRN